MQKMEDKPPYVRFEVRSVEDRDATIKAGRFMGKDVIFALITPRGSRDVHEEFADEWIKKLEATVHEQRVDGEVRFPEEWLKAYKHLLDSFKQGQKVSSVGTDLKEWPAIRPSILKMCHAVAIFTVEDLAGANEEALMNLGMGGRGLREQAKKFLEVAAGPGAQSAKMLAQDVELRRLNDRNLQLEQQVQNLMAMVGSKKEIGGQESQSPAHSGLSIGDLLEDKPNAVPTHVPPPALTKPPTVMHKL